MAKLKTPKALAKRFKITRTGKVLRRPSGQDHFLSKKDAAHRRRMRRWIQVAGPEAKIIKQRLFKA